jgi:hypothetical protein
MSNGQYQNPQQQRDPRPAEKAQQQTAAPPPPRQAEAAQPAQQAAAQVATRPAAPDISAVSVPEVVAQAGQQLRFKTGQTQVTLGRSGEHNLAVEWIDVDLVTYMSARFNVKTSPENGLDIQIEQDAYKKAYRGNGSVSTAVLPGAPVGTIGKLTARDTTTGEMLEVPWTWYNMGSRGGPGLWALIKRLIWKSGA